MESFQNLNQKAQAIAQLLKNEADNDILRALGLITLLKDEWERKLLRDVVGKREKGGTHN